MDTQTPPAAQADLTALETTVFYARVNQYAILAAYCLAVYDILLTIADEAHLISKAPRSIVKYLYFFNGYAMALAFTPLVYIMCGMSSSFSNEVCLHFFAFLLVFDNIQGNGIVGALVLSRVYVLYKNMRYIRYIVLALWLIYLIPVLVSTCHALASYYTLPGNLVWVPSLHTCALYGRPAYLWLIWPFLILVESIVCTMITYKTWKYVRSGVRTPLLSAILRDGWMYYIAMLLGEIANLISFSVAPDPLYFFAVFPFWAISTVVTSTIYLNLRNVTTPTEWDAATTAINRSEESSSDRVSTPTRSLTRRGGSPRLPRSSYSQSDDETFGIELGEMD
ncbi:hypothetical protein DACRYDRAFT_114353 [Dacryopinax primogenitus]|uniref:DUF6533 domain-containing protein n=1 Tax=Dacryopinax primogenitus (strain DJM 731) TaxID=1858805 RepID=M5G9U3_DACPD|nr:uncharacterized protein DACRYDRAFT_114353 [Dacryopinax primogenitus]EJU05070.1 hypothetical protein DACRYDRAFT_114353 [Dacryopinax primogenitus]